jgi:hypothetical protein
MQRPCPPSATRRIGVLCIFELLLALCSQQCFSQSDIDGTYMGMSVGSPAGPCDPSMAVSTIKEGILYDGGGTARGAIHEGSSLSWQAMTTKKHIPETITVRLVGDTIVAVSIEHGAPNCTWKSTQKKQGHPESDHKCKKYVLDYDGATGKHPVLDQAGHPICAELDFPGPKR